MFGWFRSLWTRPATSVDPAFLETAKRVLTPREFDFFYKAVVLRVPLESLAESGGLPVDYLAGVLRYLHEKIDLCGEDR